MGSEIQKEVIIQNGEIKKGKDEGGIKYKYGI